MEELDRAVREKSPHIATYSEEDPYGDKVEYLVDFPGITLEQLEALSSGPAVNYMEGGRIPYTSIVDPHTGKEMEGLKAVRTVKELVAVITTHHETLLARHGKGVERKLWNKISEGQVQIDLALGSAKILEAMAVYRVIAKETIRQPDVLKRRVESALDAILADAEEQLKNVKDKRTAMNLAHALRGTRLEKSAQDLAASLK